MIDTEMLTALQELINPINSKLEELDYKVDKLGKRMEDLEIKTDSYHLDSRRDHRQTQKDIQYLNDEVDTLINILEIKGILPKAK